MLASILSVAEFRTCTETSVDTKKLFGNSHRSEVALRLWPLLLRPSKFEGHCPMIRHGCRMALMVALNWSVECVKEE
ncbi:MAG: hypothetical protein BECKG1743F_GA0114225_104441, partial [Candidatus Kentron sp. G]